MLPVDSHANCLKGFVMSFYHLVYISIADKSLTEEAELMQLLAESRQRNVKAGITGMLLVCNRHIIQCIEGPRPAVKALYNQIAQDPRHRKMMVMMEGEIPERNFECWSMGFQRLEQDEVTKIPGFTNILEGHEISPAELAHCNQRLAILIQTFCGRFACEAVSESA